MFLNKCQSVQNQEVCSDAIYHVFLCIRKVSEHWLDSIVKTGLASPSPSLPPGTDIDRLKLELEESQCLGSSAASVSLPSYRRVCVAVLPKNVEATAAPVLERIPESRTPAKTFAQYLSSEVF